MVLLFGVKNLTLRGDVFYQTEPETDPETDQGFPAERPPTESGKT